MDSKYSKVGINTLACRLCSKWCQTFGGRCTFIQENAFEDVVWKMAAILHQPQCVKIVCMDSLWDLASLLSICTWLGNFAGTPRNINKSVDIFQTRFTCALCWQKINISKDKTGKYRAMDSEIVFVSPLQHSSLARHHWVHSANALEHFMSSPYPLRYLWEVSLCLEVASSINPLHSELF